MYTKQKSNFIYLKDWKEINYNRISVINALAAHLGYDKNYLEIGCQDNLLFDGVPMLNKIGVDPQRGGTHRMTSDEFFANNEQLFDLIFIDGLHTIKQVSIDLENSLSYLKKGGFIVIHDLLPRKWEEQTPKPCDDVWLGDVWKLSSHICKSNDVYSFYIVNIDHGVGILQVRDQIELPVVDAANLEQLHFHDFQHLKKQIEIHEFDEFIDKINLDATQPK